MADKPSERPILFSGPMVRAILEGRKTQTRRVVNPQPPEWLSRQLDSGFRAVRHLHGHLYGAMAGGDDVRACRAEDTVRCPYGAPGTRLWVREAFALPRRISKGGKESLAVPDHDTGGVWYCADLRDGIQPRGYRARPSIHMPRWASRLLLEVTGVRVERLQAITEQDAVAEGVLVLRAGRPCDPRTGFAVGWDTINGKRAPWDSNPWVWVVEFRRLTEADGPFRLQQLGTVLDERPAR